MRRFLCLMLAAGLLLCGCALDLEHAGIAKTITEEKPEPEELSLEPMIRIEPILYFPNPTRTKLSAESRELYLGQTEVPEVAIMKALLAGPESSDLRGLATGLSFDRVEVMPDVINVYLRMNPEFYVSESELTVSKLSTATTLIDYSGCRYVNVLVDGMQTGFAHEEDGTVVPTGALTRTTDLVDEVNVLEQKAAAQNSDIYAVLYFLDPSQSFLLPEVRRMVLLAERDMIDILVSQILAGPENSYNYMPVVDSSLVLLEHSLIEHEEGGNVIRLVFNRMPFVYTDNFESGEALALGALTYTLVDFIPDVSAIEIAARSNPQEVTVCRPQDFADLIGTKAMICLPNTPSGMTMTNVERVLEQSRGSDPRAILELLFEGPQETDSREVWPAFPDGVSMDDVQNIYRAGDMIVLSFDESVVDVLNKVPPGDERIMLFSIVNTLTSFEGVRRVLFLVDGKRKEYLGPETISILDPLMKNPGIIK